MQINRDPPINFRVQIQQSNSSKIDLAISVVTFHQKPEDLRRLLTCILKIQGLNIRIILVDNSNEPFLKDHLPISVEYLFTGKNLGYGRAHNIAIRKYLESAKYHLVLNPDISFAPGTIEGMIEKLNSNPQIGLAIPPAQYESGQRQFLARLLPSPLDLVMRLLPLPALVKNTRNTRYELWTSNAERTLVAPYLSGCFMLLRNQALKEVGLFDERFFMYFEDIDLSRRIFRSYACAQLPIGQMTHGYQRSSRKNWKLFISHIWSAIQYFSKWGWLFDSNRYYWNLEVQKAEGLKLQGCSYQSGRILPIIRIPKQIQNDPYFKKRLVFLKSFTQKKELPSTNLPSLREEVTSFALDLLQMDLGESEKISLVFLLIYGRYPDILEIEKHQKYSHTKHYIELLENLLNSKESLILAAQKKPIELFHVPHDSLLIEVGHTLRFPLNSGIQRVVRAVCQNLNEFHKKSLLFVKVDQNGLLTQLSEEETLKLTSWQKQISFLEKLLPARFYSKIANMLIPLRTTIKKNNCLKQIALSSLSFTKFVQNTFSERTAATKKQIYRVPFLQNTKVFVPELLVDDKCINLYDTLFTNFGTESTIIIYDLIPIYFPEFSGITSEFAKYLKLLRKVTKVSCISHHVGKELAHFISNIEYGQRPGPVIQCHQLGADLQKISSNSKLNLTTPPKSLVLKNKQLVCCIGSIETRKNQISIMRACAELMDEGLQFKLIFLGNPGWQYEQFLEEYLYFRRLGYDIEVELAASDERIIEIIKTSRFSIYASLAEGFGLPLVESVHLGTPCLTSKTGSMKEVGERIGGCSFVNPKDIQDIKNGVRNLFLNISMYDSLKREALSSSWRTWSEYSDEVYRFIFTRSKEPHIESESRC